MTTEARELYGRITGRKYMLLAVLFTASLLMFLADICIGPAWLSIGDVISAIFAPNSVDAATHVIVCDLRLPVALMALVVGATLGIAGAEMQTILDNPLASPHTLGVESGAGFGAALAIVYGVGVFPVSENFLVPINAFFFSMITCLLIYFIGKTKSLSKETMVLAGIAILFLFYAAQALLQYLASEEELQAIVFWLFGSLMKATWTKLAIVTGVLVVIIPLLIKDTWKLTALRLGDEKARSLGIDIERLRLKILICISILTGAAVCFVGIIGFIGLAGPHIARMLVGEDQRFFLPASALAGAVLLSAASIASKLIIPGAVFPVGILTSFIGVPIFLSLILRTKRSYW